MYPFFIQYSLMKTLISYLSKFVNDDRLQLLKSVLEQRTRHITIVLEDIYQSQNASAVVRSCDCFGIQDIHIIENENTYCLNPDVVLGASKWVSIHKYDKAPNNTIETLQGLKKKGYRIVATTPHSRQLSLQEYDICQQKTAFIFGSELTGVSDFVMQEADDFMTIPMVGFTESFNISVSAAIVLYHFTTKLRNSSISWQLTDSEKEDVLLEWLTKTLKYGDKIVKKFYNEQKISPNG